MADGERTAAGKVADEAPPRRVVLLGASNLTRGISTVVETARTLWGRPLEVLAALGHGRSYGLSSRMLGRELPGITACGLWDALAARPPARTAALVTDVGNDLLYGAPVAAILGWVAECLDRLAARDARIVLTLLPLSSVEKLSVWRFAVTRRLISPKCRARLDEILLQARALNSGLAALAAARGIPTIAQSGAWYGFDPIHIRRRFWKTAWREILAPWSEAAAPAPAGRGSAARWIYLRSRRPAEQRLFGVAQRAAQPSGRLRDGTTIALY